MIQKTARAPGALLGAGMPGMALAQDGARYNLQAPVTRVATEIYDLHTLLFWICVIIFIVVFGAMFYSVYAHRKSMGHKAANFHENTTVEIVWTVIPLLILIGIAWPATTTFLQLKDTSSRDITIGRVNYGTLIEPRILPDPALESMDGRPFRLSQLRGRWVMLHIGGARCDEECVTDHFLMRQVRLMQGREMDRIERLWLITDADRPDERLLRAYEGMQVARGPASLLKLFPAPRDPARHIYLIDPLGNLMLRFPENPDPKAMQKDIVRLLRASRVG